MTALDRVLDRPDWQSRAACLGVPLSIFFPEKHQPTGPAKAVCATCAVRPECLTEALSLGVHEPGVRAGLSQKQRRPLLRRPADEVVAEYVAKWTPTGQPAPTPAPLAVVVRLVRTPRPHHSQLPPVTCGTRRGYQHHLRTNGEACDECKEANAVYHRSRYRPLDRRRNWGDPITLTSTPETPR